ncbi:MAG: single-stranded DNA-binding protein [Firmicutes bacterium]|nr:single-stranded DNA-binding protein [Bacillota bacterium]
MYNRIVLVGRLTRDPELRHTPTGKAVAQFRLAVDRGTTNAQGERQTDFIDVVVWERQAELVSQYLTKGRLVLVEGRLEMRQYDAQDGTRRTVYEVRANTVKFLDRANAGGEPAGDRSGFGGDFREEPEPIPFGSDFNPEDDDVPF